MRIRKDGFTLLELIIVIGIVAIMASILFPLFARSRESARRVSCASNLQQLGLALNMYAQAYNGHFPLKNNDLGPLYFYINNKDAFWCPSDPNRREWKMKEIPEPARTSGKYSMPEKAWSSYVYKGGLTNDNRADTPIVSEAMTWHGDLVNILYLGGYVKPRPVQGYKPVVAPTDPPYNGQPVPPDPSKSRQTMPGPPLPSGG